MDETVRVEEGGETSDFYNSGQSTEQPDALSAGPISWTASEFLNHQKSASWYMMALALFIAIGSVLYVFTQDLIGPISIVVLGLLLMVGASRKPRTVDYTIDSSGIVIAGKEYLYDDFQSFSIVREGQIDSIALFPHKRLMPVVSIYFSPNDGQKIFEYLSEFLPFEQREKDQIDKFLHKIRF